MPAFNYDIAFGRMQALAESMRESLGTRNEATTRLQLIDRLFFECLGWSRDAAELEDHESGEYADYVLDQTSRRLIVEAKKEGAWFELPDDLAATPRLEALYSLGGTVEAALDQVMGYAGRRGTPYAAICNGHQLIAFVGSRGDGVAPRNGRALVFASPSALVERFAELWDALTPDATAVRRLSRRLRGPIAAPPPRLSEQILHYPGSAARTERQLMLGTLSVLFKPDYGRNTEQEDDFLSSCYCPPGAYSHLSVFHRGMLRAGASSALGEELQVGLQAARSQDGLNQALLDEIAITAAGREPVVLLGSLGVGKTMFLRRLLRIDAKALADDAVILYVDLGRAAVLEDIPSFITNSFRDQLLDGYNVDIDDDAFLRGTYHDEVRRFAKGPNAELKDLDPAEFKRREIDRLVELASHPESHLRRSLEHLVKLRRQQILVILDNIDQRSREDQEQTFLIAESIAKSWPCTVIVTLRPGTFNASRVGGALTGYQPRAFTVDPPRVERVIIERLRFGQRHYQAEGHLPQWFGWTTDSEDLGIYLEILLKSFNRNERLQEVLINLSGGSARRALDLVRTFVESPHSNPEELLDRNSGPRPYLLPHHVFLRAVLLGDANYYDAHKSLIPNLFDISTDDFREHFLLPCLLGLLRHEAEGAENEGYVPLADLFGTLQELHFDPDQVDFAIRRATDGTLVETLPPDAVPRAARLTSTGLYAHMHLAAEYQYLDVLTIDLPVTDPRVREQLAIVHAVRPRLERATLILSYLDDCWSRSGLGDSDLFDWPAAAAAVREEIAFIESRL